MKKSTLAAFALPLIFSAVANATEPPIGNTLFCRVSYDVDMNQSHADVGTSFTMHANRVDKGISVKQGMFGDLLNIDLKRMNGGSEDASKWQYVTLDPEEKHSTHPVDVGFGPTYLNDIAAGNLHSMRIKLGHVKETRVSTGLFSSRETTADDRIGSTPYDKIYYTEMEVNMKLHPGNTLDVELPSLHAGMRDIELHCMVK